MLAFDIAQFFLSLNHQLIPLILKKVRFDSRISYFFSDYLVNRKTKYSWDSFTFSFFTVDIGVGQKLSLSFILSALFIVFHVFEKK